MEQNKLIVNFTPTGMLPTRQMTPFVPISAAEIIDDVLEACETGISMVHLHARDKKTEEPEYAAEAYVEIIDGIRKYAPELVVCVSLSGRKFAGFEQRSAVLELTGNLKPDMGSLTLGSLNFNREASVNSPEMIMSLARRMNEKGIKPELEVFDSGMINYAKYLIDRKFLKPPYYFNLILGNIACAQADMLHAGLLVNSLPEDSAWSLGGIGRFQLTANSLAVAAGGGVRIGLEDNIWYDDARTKAARNSELLKRIILIAGAHGRTVMPPGELRSMLGLLPGNGSYGTAQNPAV